MGAVKKPIWHLALAAVLGAALGSASMASYLYLFQVAVEENTYRIEQLEKRPKCAPCAAKPSVKKPTYTAPKKWWRFWDR